VVHGVELLFRALWLRKNVIVFVSLGPDYTPARRCGQMLEGTKIDTFLH
jgi:hypothetical protein